VVLSPGGGVIAWQPLRGFGAPWQFQAIVECHRAGTHRMPGLEDEGGKLWGVGTGECKPGEKR